MSETSDVVLIGAGHNGLVCGSYLARAGLSVTVLESSHSPGGCIYTEDQPSGNRLELGAYEHGGIRGSGVDSAAVGHRLLPSARVRHTGFSGTGTVEDPPTASGLQPARTSRPGLL